MGLFEHFPWTNYQQLNLDWIIRTVKGLVTKTEKTVSIEPQTLTPSEKEQARQNIGAGTGEGAVRFDIPQNLSHDQKYQAVSNIDALSANSIDSEIARRAVMFDREQTLTENQKAQARENIGISLSGQTGAVLYNEEQNLDTLEKYRARTNIDAIDQAGVLVNVTNNAVMYTASQSVPAEQKAQARENINVYSKEETDNSIASATENVVKFTNQTLSDEQKAQTRNNIDVYSKEETDNSIASATDNVVKFTNQTLSDEQKAQTRENINVYSKEETNNAISTASTGAFKPILVWTNPNIGNNFGTADQNSSVNVSVNLATAKFVFIDFRVNSSVYSPWFMFNANDNSVKGVCVGMFTEIVCSRRVTIKKAENKINFGYASSNGDANTYYSNSVAIPYHIYVIYG